MKEHSARKRAALRQLVLYLIFGFLQLGIDWLLFVLLTKISVPLPVANLTSRVTAATAGFALNGAFTFRQQGRTALGGAQLLRYVVLWCALTATSTLAVWSIEHHSSLQTSWAAKPMVEAVLAVISFIAMKFWVYRTRR